MFGKLAQGVQRTIRPYLIFTSLLLLLGSPGQPAQRSTVPAFPGAEGFGAQSVGGRGGRIIEVTNLNDDGPGSLRAALDLAEPRIVIFRVAGTIELYSTLEIRHPYITIAGQSAPGDGITLKTHSSLTKSALRIATHDVIIRYLRIRPGPSTQASNGLDALQITNGYNIIIDHCSLSWSVDEVIGVWSNVYNVTFQWNIIAEALYESNHAEGRDHSMAMLLGNKGTGNFSVHHNLFAQNRNRTPRIKVEFGVVDVVNNVIYNPKFEKEGWATSHVSDEHGRQLVNYIGNYVKLGANSSANGYYVTASKPADNGIALFLKDNLLVDQAGGILSEAQNIGVVKQQDFVTTNQHASPAITTSSARRAYQTVIAQAGANLPTQDAVDRRIVEDVLHGTGAWINDPRDVDGWPVLQSGQPYPDQDQDGMDDDWELAYGFDPALATDGSLDSDQDGYTNVEEFLNRTNPTCWLQQPPFCCQIFLPILHNHNPSQDHGELPVISCPL